MRLAKLTPYATGVLAIGQVECVDENDGLPVRSGPVVARISKGLALPGGTRDLAGLALRLPTTGSEPWDLLMASSAGPGKWERRLPRPAMDWHTADFSSLTPFEHEHRRWWVRARCATPISTPGLSLSGFADVLRRDGVEFALTQAPSGQKHRLLAWVTLHDIHQVAAVSDDEEEHHRLADLRPPEPRSASNG